MPSSTARGPEAVVRRRTGGGAEGVALQTEPSHWEQAAIDLARLVHQMAVGLPPSPSRGATCAGTDEAWSRPEGSSTAVVPAGRSVRLEFAAKYVGHSLECGTDY